jgi:hypothetical protein
MKKVIFLGLMICMLHSFYGCSEMNDVHDEYLRNGEVLYIGRIDSARVLAGKERFLLRYWITDPRAKILKIYWSQKTDSVVVDIPAHQPLDSIDVIIGDAQRTIRENNYTIQMICTDGEGTRSVLYEENGNVYGQKFMATLLERLIKQVKYNSSTSQLTIDWTAASSAKEIGIELSYYDLDNILVVTKLTTNQIGTQTILDQIDITKDLSCRTMYLPENMAIDTFYTDSKRIVIP